MDVENLVLAAVILPICLAPQWAFAGWSRREWVMLALLAQYGLLHLASVTVWPGPGDGTLDRDIEEPRTWIWITVLPVLMIARAHATRDMSLAVRRVLPGALSGVFVLMAAAYATPWLGESCRVGGTAHTLFVPVMFVFVLTLLTFVGWTELSQTERGVRYLLVAMCLVTCAGFAGARMAIAVEVLTFTMLAVGLAILLRRWRDAAYLVAAVAGGLVAAMVIDAVAGCNMGERIARLGGAMSGAAPVSADNSLAVRLELWERSWEAISTGGWLGYGVVAEGEIMKPVQIHAHSPYLSWLIWVSASCSPRWP